MPHSNSSTSSKSSSSSTPRNHLPFGPIMSSSQIPSYTPSSNTPSSTPGFFATMKEGIALGAGSSIGSRIVSSVFGPPSIEVKSSTPVGSQSGSTSGSTIGKCDTLQTSFNTCIQERKPNDICEEQLNLLNKCLSS